MLPMLFKYYWTPIQLQDVPALREDDAAASSLGSFRADQAMKDIAYATKHGGQNRRRNLGWDMLTFFGPEIRLQCVSQESSLPIVGINANIIRIDLGHDFHHPSIPPSNWTSTPTAICQRSGDGPQR